MTASVALAPTSADNQMAEIAVKRLLTVLLCCLSLMLSAEPQHQHDYNGSHGMVLFSANNTLLVSHLPLYRPPHDYQLVYEVILPELASKAVLAELSQTRQLTLLPENFDLRQMIDAGQFTLNADIYQGHFEREGTLWLSKLPVRFVRQLYKRRLNNTDVIAGTIKYATFTSAGQQFMLHQIGTAPSFDQILRVSEWPQTLQFDNADAQSATVQLQQQGIEVQQLYLESRDFSL